MTEDTRKFVEEKTKEILNAGSCCPELKEMAEKWLAAEETTDEKAVTEAYLQELSEDVLPIDAPVSYTHLLPYLRQSRSLLYQILSSSGILLHGQRTLPAA